MTRINCIPVQELTNQHLLAEYRELPRVLALVRAAILRGETPKDGRNPSQYTLGKGHVRFFYPRLLYLAKRQDCIVAELLSRGYNLDYVDSSIARLWEFPKEWCNDWVPDDRSQFINRARILERLTK